MVKRRTTIGVEYCSSRALLTPNVVSVSGGDERRETLIGPRYARSYPAIAPLCQVFKMSCFSIFLWNLKNSVKKHDIHSADPDTPCQ